METSVSIYCKWKIVLKTAYVYALNWSDVRSPKMGYPTVSTDWIQETGDKWA